MMTENAGIFVVRAKELSLAGGVNKVGYSRGENGCSGGNRLTAVGIR